MKKAETFPKKLMDWFLSAMRPLPWRDRYDPYRVWISEIMLQQTQMERGVRYFNAWMTRFPDVSSVADAAEETILAAWEGLGYYSRARNLHAAAKRIMEAYGGKFPDTYEEIRSLPGVGDYTAGAIASIAFNQNVPAVDANVLRIFARVLDIDLPVTDKAARERITAAVIDRIPPESPRLFNQSLMEFGALVCAKTPKCAECPVSAHCEAHANGITAIRPVKAAKTQYALHETTAGIILDKEGKAFIRKRPPAGLWAGLWEFPGGAVACGESPGEAVLRTIKEQTGARVRVTAEIGVVRHGYTTNRVVMHGYLCEMRRGSPEPVPASPDQEQRRVAPDEASGLAFAAGHRKLLELLGWKRDL